MAKTTSYPPRSPRDPRGRIPNVAMLPDYVGCRVVIRYRREEGGFSDALGTLEQADDATVTIHTRHGLAVVEVSKIAIAKQVPGF